MEGYKLMMKMCRPRKPRKDEPEGLYWHEDPKDLERLYAYCMKDVEAEECLSNALRDLPDQELKIWQLDQVIKGWTEGVTMMVEGERTRFWIPQDLAYKGQKGRPAGTLVFDIELVGAEPSPSTPPPDVAKVPSDASRLPSGLAYRVLTPGVGARKPYSSSEVTVHYTGWTTDGRMFDSSVMRGQPTTFRLDEVIKGWTEGVQLMVEGEKTRFWIPQNLAYEQGGGPRGMLVFDVELIDIK